MDAGKSSLSPGMPSAETDSVARHGLAEPHPAGVVYGDGVGVGVGEDEPDVEVVGDGCWPIEGGGVVGAGARSWLGDALADRVGDGDRVGPGRRVLDGRAGLGHVAGLRDHAGLGDAGAVLGVPCAFPAGVAVAGRTTMYSASTARNSPATTRVEVRGRPVTRRSRSRGRC